MPHNSHTLPVGVYRHYKGGLYKVHKVGRMHNSLESVVIYESLQDKEDFPAGTYFVRPFFEFTETFMDREGNEVERFVYQDEEVETEAKSDSTANDMFTI